MANVIYKNKTACIIYAIIVDLRIIISHVSTPIWSSMVASKVDSVGYELNVGTHSQHECRIIVTYCRRHIGLISTGTAAHRSAH